MKSKQVYNTSLCGFDPMHLPLKLVVAIGSYNVVKYPQHYYAMSLFILVSVLDPAFF